MLKKLLTFVFGLTLMTSFATAQTESTIAAGDIVYWVGEGDGAAIFVIEHGNGAVAWGYRFDPAAGETVEEMATAISDADPRMFYGWGMLAYTQCMWNGTAIWRRSVSRLTEFWPTNTTNSATMTWPTACL